MSAPVKGCEKCGGTGVQSVVALTSQSQNDDATILRAVREVAGDWLSGKGCENVEQFMSDALRDALAERDEAQAKLEALLAGEGDLPEGWTEEWRWSVGVDHGSWRRSREVTVASATACRISGYVVERHLVSPAVRVEEGGES